MDKSNPKSALPPSLGSGNGLLLLLFVDDDAEMEVSLSTEVDRDPLDSLEAKDARKGGEERGEVEEEAEEARAAASLDDEVARTGVGTSSMSSSTAKSSTSMLERFSVEIGLEGVATKVDVGETEALEIMVV